MGAGLRYHRKRDPMPVAGIFPRMALLPDHHGRHLGLVNHNLLGVVQPVDGAPTGVGLSANYSPIENK